MMEMKPQEGGEERMKKAPDKKVLAREAAYWEAVKKAASENPGKLCRK